MRSPTPSTLVSRMISFAASPATATATANKTATRVRHVVWVSQAEAVRSALPCYIALQIEAAVAADLDAMAMPEVFFTSVETFGRVITCDLDSNGIASIFSIIDPTEYDDLVEEAGDEALFGVDRDGVYVNPTRTRH